MAAVAQSGAREALCAYPSPTMRSSDSPSLKSEDSPSTTISPRCEAFVMTGDKILNLNHHVSPSYAKVARDQLPPSTQILENPKPRPPLLTDFPSVRRSMRSRMPNSRSQPEEVSTQRQAHLFALSYTMDLQISCPDPVVENHSSERTSNGSQSFIVPTSSHMEDKSPAPSVEDKSEAADGACGDFATNTSSTTAIAVGMESSMHSSYYKSAFSNPQLSKRNGSTDTFVISTTESPTKQSTVTVNAINCAPSVSSATSPLHRRLFSPPRRQSTEEFIDEVTDIFLLKSSVSVASIGKATQRTAVCSVKSNGGTEVFGSFRSNDADSHCEEEREAAHEAARLFRLEGCTKADVAERLNDRVELHGDSTERERLLRFFSARYHQSDPNLFNSVDDVHTLTCALLLLNADLHGQNCGKKMTIRDFINNISHTGKHFKRDLLKSLYNSIKENEIMHASNFERSTRRKSSSRRSFISNQLILEVDPESQVEYKCGYIMRKCIYEADGTRTPFGRRGWKEWYARLRGLVLYLGRDDSDKKRSSDLNANMNQSIQKIHISHKYSNFRWDHAPFGRRGWKEWYARLRGLVLYLGRDDSDKKRSRFEMFNNAISLHHAFAEPAEDYKKKQFIFRLRTANLGEFLFQTVSKAEVDDWVTQINFACARFSSRALPPPVCSDGAFLRARLPKLPSSAPLALQLKLHESAVYELQDQLNRVRQEAPPLKAKGRPVEEFFFKERYLTQEGGLHESAVYELQDQLNRVRQEAPPLKAKGRPVEEFFFKERYLTQEIQRYDTYCQLLRSRIPGGGCGQGGASSDSTSGVHSKFDIAEDVDKMSYREAMNH
ncbi:PH domain protein [Dictyocaulus viviparus]|uniref:PH domain protein n=1 Tax=Dictyocaulus viviparus TaxID=29172 RepID=A0A0D8XUF3_DICVI|nr:PH domain protein [Dictyocaulus viviparus]